MSMLSFDEDGARRIQRTYSTADVVRQRAEVLALLAAQPGERVLDVGSGPGFLVASLADAVGAGGAVHGVDPSAPMNALARELLGTRPWARIDDGNALELPYADGAFDAAVSTQVYEYVEDIPRALSELRRVLRPGGRASSSTPTGTRWCGTRPIASSSAASWPPGRSTSCTLGCRAPCPGTSGVPGSG